MKKSILIIGSQCSGKSTKARELASQFKSEEVVILDPRLIKSHNCFQEVTKKTKCIVVDDIPRSKKTDLLMLVGAEKFIVSRKYRDTQTIDAARITLIVVDNGNFMDLTDPSVQRRFDIIDMDNQKELV